MWLKWNSDLIKYVYNLSKTCRQISEIYWSVSLIMFVQDGINFLLLILIQISNRYRYLSFVDIHPKLKLHDQKNGISILFPKYLCTYTNFFRSPHLFLTILDGLDIAIRTVTNEC